MKVKNRKLDKSLSKEDRKNVLIKSLQDAQKELGDIPSISKANSGAYGMYPAHVYSNAFGNWTGAITAAGMKPRISGPKVGSKRSAKAKDLQRKTVAKKKVSVSKSEAKAVGEFDNMRSEVLLLDIRIAQKNIDRLYAELNRRVADKSI